MKTKIDDLLKKSASGDSEAMYLLAQEYENEGDFDTAFLWHNEAANHGSVGGIHSVAMYFSVTCMAENTRINWRILKNTGNGRMPERTSPDVPPISIFSHSHPDSQ